VPDDYPTLPGFYQTKRSLAIGGNKLIVPTVDMHVIALDVRTRVPQSSGALSTAGGLVFSATPDRYFRAKNTGSAFPNPSQRR
jgi:hypothetical protein